MVLMKMETKAWLAQARADYESALYLADGKKYSNASFLAQQTAEKALKAVIIESIGDFPKIHDINNLAVQAKLPDSIRAQSKELTIAYTATRYPDIHSKNSFNEIHAHRHIKIAEVILLWAEKTLK